MIELFAEKKDCCGCGACMNICPKTAIHMEKVLYGWFRFEEHSVR